MMSAVPDFRRSRGTASLMLPNASIIKRRVEVDHRIVQMAPLLLSWTKCRRILGLRLQWMAFAKRPGHRVSQYGALLREVILRLSDRSSSRPLQVGSSG